MANMEMKKCPMPSQTAELRSKNFDEVALGYTDEMAVREASRCLGCKNAPCREGCPVGIDIPAFVARVAEGDVSGAYGILSRSTTLAAVCGRVCPQESQCEGKCVRGLKGEPVAIGRLERFVADRHREQGGGAPAVSCGKNGKKVAVVGSGPSGLTCAGELARLGYAVTVLEALHTPGGVLVYGIPEFRLPKVLVEKEINTLKAMGVTVETNVIVGKTVTVDDLLEEGYAAVYLASGAGLPTFLGIPGETLNGVLSANEYLTRINLMGAYRPESATPVPRGGRVIVIGGGNVAMDAARCAKRLGGEVTVVYRRSMEELPARQEEVEHAQEEGVAFHLLTAPIEILGDENGWVRGLSCQRMELGEPDASGRRRPVPVADGMFTLEADTVILAIGTSPNPLLPAATPGLETDGRGCIVTGEGGRTSRPRVYAGGDAVTGAATVILAMGAGKEAAAAIHRDLSEE